MDFSFETQGVKTYLVYQISENDSLDSLCLGMVTNNKINGVAPILYTQMDENKYLKYNVSARIPVSKFFAGAVTKKRMLSVFLGIIDTIITAEEYMIDFNMFVFDLDYIFVDVTTCEVMMICLPLENKQNDVDISAFFKNIVFTTQYDQTENNDYVAKIISFLNGSAIFSLNDFKLVIRQLLEFSTRSYDFQPVVNKSQVSQMSPGAATVQPQKPMQQAPAPVQPAYQVPKSNAVQPVVNAPQQQAFSVPKGSNVKPNLEAAKAPASGNENKVTMFQLLMHYSKENKEAYKAQKQAKAAAPSPAQNNKPPVKSKPSGFAIPGMETNMSAAQQQTQPAAQTPIVSQPVRQQQAVPVQTFQPAPQPVMATHAANFGETTVLNNANVGATTVLGADTAAQSIVPYLIRKKTNEKINLTKPVFSIGKEKSFSDYFIGDNTAISRSHADFTTRDGEYFVTDMNSTNHTYVNGVMIQSSIEVKLTHGTVIKLANEEFEFRMY